MKSLLATLFLAALTCSADTIYTLNPITINSVTATGTITTDGTIGTLDTGNIVAYSVLLSNGSTNVTDTNVNGQLEIGGTDLTATATQLLFNFSDANGGFVLSQTPSIGGGSPGFCFQVVDQECVAVLNGEEALFLAGATQSTPLSGNDVIATASQSATPEPSSFALFGLGAAALFARRRR